MTGVAVRVADFEVPGEMVRTVALRPVVTSLVAALSKRTFEVIVKDDELQALVSLLVTVTV